MPTYDFECVKCKHRFEERRSFSDDGNHAKCPRCKGKAQRVFISVPVIFKGSGFYVTDHRKGSPADNGGNGSVPKPEEKKVEKVETAKTDK